ncbi:MAG TPA: hypothetical protein VFK41_12725 [Nocardioidaceae bacterium]|nr:hypothetical protein [Nocardioidaceae bacterium]
MTMSLHPTRLAVATVTTTVSASVIALLTGLHPADAAGSAPAPLEPIRVERTIAMPPGVELLSGQANALKLLPGEEWVLANVAYEGANHVGAIELDGGGFSCITCDVLASGREANLFSDGRRILVSSGGSGAGDIQFEVVTCTPSLVDCREKTATPLTLPKDGLAQGAQNREPRLHPDGKHLTWTEVRATEGPVMLLGDLVLRQGEYRVDDPRVLNPTYRLGLDSEQWALAGRYHETGGGWLDGGRTLVYRSTSTALNYDIWALDLVTGERRLITHDVDYNEMFEPSPDNRTFAYASARGLDRMDVVTALRRPTFLDTVAFAQVGRAALWNNRRCMNERWLMDAGGQRGTYAGQPVVLRDNWVMRGWDWFHDSSRAVITEEEFTPEAGGATSRGTMRIISFPTRQPTEPVARVDLDTIDYAEWAPAYDDYVGIAGRQVPAAVVPGARAGSVLLSYSGVFGAGTWSATYRNYSDDGRSFLNGTETLTTPLAPAAAVWSADLRSQGAQNGTLKGDLAVYNPAEVAGSVESTVDGVHREGLPTQANCPGVRQPTLRMELLDRWRSHGRYHSRVRVSALVPEDPVARPVLGAEVGWSEGTAETDRNGDVVVVHKDPGLALTVTADGFKPGSLLLP